ncbi:MAG TPA: endonuclease V, partial [Azospirillaceae bacterium]|nr:endonuclease V [Azospirillaceae bacterium]
PMSRLIGEPALLAAAREEQRRIAALARFTDDFPDPPRRIAALDAHYDEAAGVAFAAAALISVPARMLEASALAALPIAFPYVSGFLSFREAPAMLKALALLPGPSPDLLVVDGQGLAHPRRCGLACHVGVLAGLPAVGLAKSRLTGRFDPPGPDKGDWSPLISRKQWVGAAVRTRAGHSPIFVSPGHRVSIESAVRLALAFTGKWRLPEPIRIADALSRTHGTRGAAARQSAARQSPL